jgi:hypothetical protein
MARGSQVLVRARSSARSSGTQVHIRRPPKPVQRADSAELLGNHGAVRGSAPKLAKLARAGAHSGVRGAAAWALETLSIHRTADPPAEQQLPSASATPEEFLEATKQAAKLKASQGRTERERRRRRKRRYDGLAQVLQGLCRRHLARQDFGERLAAARAAAAEVARLAALLPAYLSAAPIVGGRYQVAVASGG